MLNWVTPTFRSASSFLRCCFDRADEAEAVDDFVADEIGVVAADFAVVMIVVGALTFDEGRERCGEFFGLVFGDQIHHVIRNEGRETSGRDRGRVLDRWKPRRGRRP